MSISWGVSKLYVSLLLMIVASVMGMSLLYFYSVNGLVFQRDSNLVRVAVPKDIVSTIDYVDVMRIDARYGFNLNITRFDNITWVESALARDAVDIVLVSVIDAARLVLSNIDVIVIAVDMYYEPDILNTNGERDILVGGVFNGRLLSLWVVRRSYYLENAYTVEGFIEARVEAAIGWINNKNIVIDILMNRYGVDESSAYNIYAGHEVYPNYLNEFLIKNIRDVWSSAYNGGVLERDPSLISSEIFLGH